MNQNVKKTIFLLRIVLGWLLFYAGITKFLDPSWTATGFLQGATTFSDLFGWFALDSNIGWVNFLNIWGLMLIGLGLITGTFTRLASLFGVLLMGLYYLPTLDFPYVAHGFIVDEHIIYIFIFLLMIYTNAGQLWGIDKELKKKFKLKGWWF